MRPFDSHTIDYSALDNAINKRSFKLTASELAAKGMERVAFDVVRFSDGDLASRLWEVQSADDGDYIISIYDEPEVEKTASVNAGGWEVIFSKTANRLNVFYKGEQLASLSADNLGIPEGELTLVERYLPARLASNKSLVASLIKELPQATQTLVSSRYPEILS